MKWMIKPKIMLFVVETHPSATIIDSQSGVRNQKYFAISEERKGCCLDDYVEAIAKLPHKVSCGS